MGRGRCASSCCTTSTYSINSLCHFFGRRRFATEDHSRNLLWLAPLSFGEAWHNNHHAFPTSAFHGMGRREIDFSGIADRGDGARRPRVGRAADQPAAPGRQGARGLSAARAGAARASDWRGCASALGSRLTRR